MPASPLTRKKLARPARPSSRPCSRAWSSGSRPTKDEGLWGVTGSFCPEGGYGVEDGFTNAAGCTYMFSGCRRAVDILSVDVGRTVTTQRIDHPVANEGV